MSTTPNSHTSVAALLRSLCICIALVASAGSAAAAPDGADIASACDDCHGTDGRSEKPDIPSIAGFSEFAIMDLMQTYRDGMREGRRMERTDGTETDMVEVSRAITDEELEAVALHYADKTWIPHPQPFDAQRAHMPHPPRGAGG
ncbi:MAG: hypothetical protein OXS50_02570, partial [Gammaproteobacteria bacterium]|nr:hypothetical protein [Gammaproteobacteria bacterium]